MDKKRCSWCEGDPIYETYHDREWGRVVREDRVLFEFLILEGFQAGLSWITILKKRAAFREAFDLFDYEKIAKYKEEKLEAEAKIKDLVMGYEAEMQKQQALAETTIQIEQAKIQFEINKMLQEAKVKKELMAEEFSYNMQLAQMKAKGETQKEQEIEDRKDSRIQKQGTQESQLINQRQNNTLPQDFESAGFDGLGGFGLEQFSPR